MRFITADIINSMNDIDSQTDQFEKTWNQRMDCLQDNFDEIRERLPENVLYFYEHHTLLGCPVFCRANNYKTEEYFFVIGKQSDNQILYISYDMPYQPELDLFSGMGFSSEEPAVWLYDEFHLKKDFYEHHIIFSDGNSYVIPFRSFYLRTTKWFDE